MLKHNHQVYLVTNWACTNFDCCSWWPLFKVSSPSLSTSVLMYSYIHMCSCSCLFFVCSSSWRTQSTRHWTLGWVCKLLLLSSIVLIHQITSRQRHRRPRDNVFEGTTVDYILFFHSSNYWRAYELACSKTSSTKNVFGRTMTECGQSIQVH